MNIPRFSHLLTGELYLEAKDGGEDHLDVLEEAVVTVIVAVQANLVRVDHRVVIFSGDLLHRTSVPLRLTRGDIFRNQLIL